MNKIFKFFKKDIWNEKLEDLGFFKRTVLKVFKLSFIAGKGFKDDGCEMRASALTFYSLLSLVPAVAVLFGIAKGFGFEKVVQKELYENFMGNKNFLDKIFEFSNTLLENTKGDFIAVIGLIILFWTIIKVLGNIESSFNKIWKIEESRSFIRRFSDYMSLMFISPIFIIFSSAINVFVQRQINKILEIIAIHVVFEKAIQLGVSLVPYLLIYTLLTIVYMVMPNKKVNIRSAFYGALFAGTAYQIMQWLYISFQIGVVRYNAIYGSFAVIPLLLLWFRISWTLVLFGGEISFAHQNIKAYGHQVLKPKLSIYKHRILSFIILRLVIDNFINTKMKLNKEKLSMELEIPVEIISLLVDDLVSAKLLSEVKNISQDIIYQPALAVDRITVKYALDKIEKVGNDKFFIKHNKKTKAIHNYMREIRKRLIKELGEDLVKDISI